MKRLFLILFFVATWSCSFAAELKADFTLSGEVSAVKEGDLVEATLKLWPIENIDAGEFYKLQNVLLFNSFQVIQLQSVEPSANNADVVEVKGTFIVRASKNMSAYVLNYKGQSVTVSPPMVKIIPLDKKAEDYFILDQSLSLSQYQLIVFFIVLLLIALAAFIKREKIMAVIKGLRKDPQAQAIKYFNDKFSRASTREEYEEIYAKKNDWIPLLKERPLVYKEFFDVMNQHQYKARWGSEELQEVKNIFDIIRGSFK